MNLKLLKTVIKMSSYCFLGILLTCMSAGVLLADRSLAQPKRISEVKITLELEEATPEEALRAIESKTEFRFLYKKRIFEGEEIKLNLKARNQTVAWALEQIARQTGLSFRQLNNTIAVKVNERTPSGKPAEPIETVTSIELKINRTIAGTVTDEKGQSLPGTTVAVKGSSIGTTTDIDGNYKLSVPDNATTLIYSFIGYKTLEVDIAGRSVVNVIMQVDVATLQEVVVNAGYYTVKDRERTGNISNVTSREIEQQPIISPLQALEGRMAGVEVEQGTGITGRAPRIQIRGRNSLRSDGNYPLYIIDGIPVNSSPLRSAGWFSHVTSYGLDPLSTMDLSNIESIEVLKDADATAIYGSRGANGVVLITTKKGRNASGRTSFETRIYSGVSRVSNKAKLLNTEQYVTMREQAFENDGATPTETNAPDLMQWDQEHYTDWQDVLFGGTAATTDINMNVSGGNEHTSYLVGGSYHKQGSVFPGDFDYNKLTANFNFNHRSDNEKFQLDFSSNYGVDDNKVFFGSSFVRNALTIPPNAPAIYKEDGTLNWEGWLTPNPLSELYMPQDIYTENLFANMGLSYEIIQGVMAKVHMGYSKLNQEQWMRSLKESMNPSYRHLLSLTASRSSAQRRSWILEPQVLYAKDFDKITINALIGASFQDNNDSYLSINGSGYADESLMKNLDAADEVSISSNDNTGYRYGAVFGRVGLNWVKKYFLNLTGRRDGSSRFGPNKRFSNFWALGTAWIFSEEKAIKDHLPFLSFGKLRGSYGTTGNDQIPDYGFMDTYEATDGPGGLYPTQLFNSDYSWEVNKKLETALQLGFLKDHINVEVSWYRNRSSNQLVGYPLPAITGFTSVQANLPALVQNTGWEIELTTLNVRKNDFSWHTSLNVTFPDNKLLEFDDLDQTSYANRYRVGHPLNIRLLYQYDGIDPQTGFYHLTDINDDGRYNNDDRTVIKNMGRMYYGGISNDIRYKQFSLHFLFEYIRQNNFSYAFEGAAPGTYGNKPAEFLNAWEKPGDNENIQKISSSAGRSAFNRAAGSSLGIDEASFLRLKNLSISYQLPGNILKKLKIEAVNVFVQGQNLLTITKYLGLDPQGGRGEVPPLKTITCGLQVNL